MQSYSIENDIISRENNNIPSPEDCPWIKTNINNQTSPILKFEHRWKNFLKKQSIEQN